MSGLAERALRVGVLVAGLALAAAVGAQQAAATGTVDELRRLLDGGRYADAERDARAALAALEQAGSAASLNAADVLDVLVAALWRGGKASDPDAAAFAERAIEIKQKQLGADAPAVATSLDNAGVLFFVRADYERAAPLYERALQILSRAAANDPRYEAELGRVHSHLGPLFQELGQYSTAREHYERSLEVFRETLGPANTQVAMTANNLATLLSKIGDYDEALRLYREALVTLERALGPEHPLIANGKHNLAELDQRMGRGDEAAALYRETIALKEKVLGPAHPSLALSLSNLSYLSSDRLDLDAALTLAEQALQIQERAYGPDHVDVAYALISLGRAQTGRGDYEGARATLERALTLRSNALGPDNPLVAEPLHFLGEALLRAGRDREAFEIALRAESIARNHLRLTARGAPERQALRYSAERLSGLDLALTIAANLRDPSLSESGWDALIRSRAVVLDEMATRRRLADQGDESAREAFAAYRTAAERLVNVLLRGPGAGNVEEYQRKTAELRADEEAAERRVAAASESVRAALAERELGFREVAAALPDGATLVAFARVGGDARSGVAEASYLAFVLEAAAGSPRIVPLGNAREVETAIRRWRGELRPEAAALDATRYRAAGERVRELLWDPLGVASTGDRLVLIVPAGAIHLVNFSALPLRSGLFLAEADVLIHYLSSERELLTAPRRAASPEVLVVGGVDFEAARPAAGAERAASDACDPLARLDIPPLPGSLREARRVASTFRDARGAAPSITELTAEFATKAAFEAQAPGKTVVHVATHGFFVADGCSTGQSDVASPLRLSGLAFSTRERDTGDAILLAEEVAALDLRAAQWVVLSGCDTGIGQIEVDEGILGLRRAFRIAGAGTLVMSLWPVEDRSAETFMAALYDARFNDDRSTSAAMRAGYRAALAAARRQHGEPHPLYWAPFIASGDWR
ncbi:MAG TPA: CHAT domain-containing tetratricopeptide repeat protein [Gammaproteobacteria bacterium]|nr:CHAT domain-containing tetratricopeptide repeat protein [Gammaproteobacteria bacterium]